MRRRKMISTLLFGGLLMFVTSTKTFAEPSRGGITPSVPPQNIQSKIDEAENAIEQYDSQIENLIYDLQEIQSQMGRIQSEILSTEKELKNIENTINESKEVFDSRVKAMYINGVDSYLSVLLDSKSFSDFISKVDAVKTIMEFDSKALEELNSKKEEIESKKSILEDKREELQRLQNENQEKLNKLNKLKDDQEKLIKQLKESSPKPTIPEKFNFTPGSSKGDSIVAFALQYRGVPYVWGGTSPSGFDCSGFTKYVFNNFGINLERRSSSQAKQGIPIGYNSLQPGDLVFFGSPIHHVGIYVGNDMFIHAPRTGDVVKVSPMRYMDFNCARRLLP